MEALLLVAVEPVSVTELAQSVGVPEAEVAEALGELVAFYDETGRGFELRELGGGWRYYTREEYADLITRHVLEGQHARLSQAALETLAVVAYSQPISRGRVSAVRGVNVDGVMRTLLARGLIEEAGHDHDSGAVVFATTSYFLERMGLRSLDELPELAPHLPEVSELEAELGQLAERGEAMRPEPVEGRPERTSTSTTEAEGVRPSTGSGQRLQKVLAAAGVASRRACEVMISEGRVEVNGKVVTEQGRRVDPDRDVIRVDGSRIPPPRRYLYLVLNKPRGVVSTMDDPQGRRTVADLIPERKGRLFHVGRLDTDTEGLLILTNDGDFAQRLAHPSYEVPKTYLAEVAGLVGPPVLRRLREGVRLEDGPVRPTSVKLVSTAAEKSLIKITLPEGRNHIVRRTMEAVGHPVRRLSRTGIGPVRLGNLKIGEFRELTRDELGGLLDLTGS